MTWTLPEVLRLVVESSYLVAAALFLLGLQRMASPRTARSGIQEHGRGVGVRASSKVGGLAYRNARGRWRLTVAAGERAVVMMRPGQRGTASWATGSWRCTSSCWPQSPAT